MRSIKRAEPMSPDRSFQIGAFDLETDGLGGAFIAGAVAHENGALFDTTSINDLLDYMLCCFDEHTLQRTIWYAHNMEFDLRYLLEYFTTYSDLYDLQLCERAQGVIYQVLVLRKGQTGKSAVVTTFRDSMALFPNSLADFTRQFAPDMRKLDIGLSRGVTFDPSNTTHIEYLHRDVRSLIEAIKNFDDLIYTTFGTHVRGTISSTAYQAFLRCCPEDAYYWRVSKSTEQWLRPSYVGGMVRINGAADYHEDVVVCDINSSYPAQMRKGVPYGRHFRTRYWQDGKPGIYQILAYCPDDVVFPCISTRLPHGELVWARGVFEARVTSIEVEKAIEQGYYVEIIEGVVFEKLVYPFNDFVDKCETLRNTMKGTPTEIVVKLIQNSLYGKFGTREDGRELIVCFYHIPEDYLPYMDAHGEWVDGVYWRAVERDAEYMMVHWAAWITANARLQLVETFEIAGPENVFYGDTDSGHMTREGARRVEEAGLIGPKYGQFKVEKTLDEVRYWSPKSYTYKKDGSFGAVCKGIPRKFLRDQAFVARLHAGELPEVHYESVTSTSTFLKTGKLSVMRSRRPTNIANVAGHVIEAGQFRPLKVGV